MNVPTNFTSIKGWVGYLKYIILTKLKTHFTSKRASASHLIFNTSASGLDCISQGPYVGKPWNQCLTMALIYIYIYMWDQNFYRLGPALTTCRGCLPRYGHVSISRGTKSWVRKGSLQCQNSWLSFAIPSNYMPRKHWEGWWIVDTVSVCLKAGLDGRLLAQVLWSATPISYEEKEGKRWHRSKGSKPYRTGETTSN